MTIFLGMYPILYRSEQLLPIIQLRRQLRIGKSKADNLHEVFHSKLLIDFQIVLFLVFTVKEFIF
jgi:hypothetical protein